LYRTGETGALLRKQDCPYIVRGSATEIDGRQPPLQVIITPIITSGTFIVAVLRVRKGIIIETILLEALEKIYHRLALRGRRRRFRVDVGRQLVTIKWLRALRMYLESTHR
jgi:hypothetical protein